MGEVNDEKDFYKKVDIIVNPMPKGSTGLKIKTIDAFAYKLLGYSFVSVYDGSMSEWVLSDSRPLTVGPNP